jgi:hypothetical protein
MVFPPCYNVITDIAVSEYIQKGGINMPTETFNFLKSLYSEYQKYNSQFTICYSHDMSEKRKQAKMFEYLESEGYIVRKANVLGYRTIDFTEYGISYMKNLA